MVHRRNGRAVCWPRKSRLCDLLATAALYGLFELSLGSRYMGLGGLKGRSVHIVLCSYFGRLIQWGDLYCSPVELARCCIGRRSIFVALNDLCNV